MNKRISQIAFYLVLTITLFSLWAGFALFVVNALFYKDLPGYTIGRICVWEYIAIVLAGLIAWIMIRNWGSIRYTQIDGKRRLVLNPKYGVYFLIYLTIALAVAIWQFWLFSQNF